MIVFSYFDNCEHFGNQYLMENPDKSESFLQKGGISIIQKSVLSRVCCSLLVIDPHFSLFLICISILFIRLYTSQRCFFDRNILHHYST